jgi:hypothetical protein
MVEKGDKAMVHFDVFQKCPHCGKMISKEIKMATPPDITPEQFIPCPECKKQILVHCPVDLGYHFVCFIKYPVVISL